MVLAEQASSYLYGTHKSTRESSRARTCLGNELDTLSHYRPCTNQTCLPNQLYSFLFQKYFLYALKRNESIKDCF